MKRELLDILCCPACRGSLEIRVTGETGGDVVTGSLTCTKCRIDYAIEGGIPIFITESKAE